MGPDDQEHLEAALAEKKKLSDLYCTGCNYCMPCPHGVDIPGNLALMNLHRLYGATEWASQRYAWKKAEGESGLRASACVQCGECEPKCPQNIPIIEQLAETHAALGGDT